ncbi:hypothetical protein [Coralloluteibacterium stylophorae]|uniref:Uncharacterized protein n=1 Tax=Coralloluteibacterium stylophorae TaxID=1776034 RepID=A0A8J8AWS3_9GAMM|nr:hypothetical protein [Coralloluteibacterium stylophorae]MBS7458226.1 hypothetical protein [Coralloluteibacterium stylophorae]
MSRRALRDRVADCERNLVATRRGFAADRRQLVETGRRAATPGRIVVVGLLGGFLLGRMRPVGPRALGAVKLAKMFAPTLIRGASAIVSAVAASRAASAAQESAEDADAVADRAEDVAEALDETAAQ